MNGIVGMADLLLGTDLNAEQRESAEAVRNSADALLQIIGDILDFSKLEAGKSSIRPVEFDPSALVMEVSRLLRVQANANGIELRISVEPDVPAAAIGDVTRIRQVLLNLAANALKFTEAGWVEVRLRAGIRDARPCLSFEVQDTGIGIAPDQAGLLFESFEQLDNSLTRKHGGTGLGLAISRQLIELMDGEITFDSRVGDGSTFRFTVPVECVERRPKPAALLPVAAAVNGDRSGVRILLAEDIDLNRRIALRMLERLGYRADTVGNGRLAVEAVRNHPYDLVFLDVHMPEMDGFTAIREIRKFRQNAHRPVVVAMTARAMAGDREQCLAAGMDDYISKPVRLDDIRAVVEKWVSSGEAETR
jgi:CheY-like chemotaxis protein